jgi:acetolactate synthase-1/2/3 large subunit
MTTAGYQIVTPPTPQNTLIHVLAGAEELGRVYRPEFALNCSPAAFCAALNTVSMPSDYERTQMSAAHAEYVAFSTPVTVQGDLQLAQIVASFAQLIPRNAVLCNGAGNFAAWLHRFYPYGPFRTQLAPANGSMGYGLPAAITAKLLDPQRVAIAFCGDGDFMMTCQELATAMRYDAYPIVIIVNNGILGTIRMHQEREFKNRVLGTGLTNPDFIKLAESFGMPGYRVSKTAEFAAAFAAALKSKTGAVIELILDPEIISPSKLLSKLS